MEFRLSRYAATPFATRLHAAQYMKELHTIINNKYLPSKAQHGTAGAGASQYSTVQYIGALF